MTISYRDVKIIILNFILILLEYICKLIIKNMKTIIISVHIYFINIKYKVQDYDFYVTIIDGDVTIFQIRLQTPMQLFGQAKFPSM